MHRRPETLEDPFRSELDISVRSGAGRYGAEGETGRSIAAGGRRSSPE